MKIVMLAVSLEDWLPFSYVEVGDVLGEEGSLKRNGL